MKTKIFQFPSDYWGNLSNHFWCSRLCTYMYSSCMWKCRRKEGKLLLFSPFVSWLKIGLIVEYFQLSNEEDCIPLTRQLSAIVLCKSAHFFRESKSIQFLYSFVFYSNSYSTSYRDFPIGSPPIGVRNSYRGKTYSNF
jgi:hypothetical protein